MEADIAWLNIANTCIDRPTRCRNQCPAIDLETNNVVCSAMDNLIALRGIEISNLILP